MASTLVFRDRFILRQKLMSCLCCLHSKNTCFTVAPPGQTKCPRQTAALVAVSALKFALRNRDGFGNAYRSTMITNISLSLSYCDNHNTLRYHGR